MSGNSKTDLNPYLMFDGKCTEAMKFYKDCLGGELNIMTHGETNPDCPPAMKNRVMHSNLISDRLTLMASDGDGNDAKAGNNVQLSFNCRSADEIKAVFQKLSAGGNVKMPLQDTFWGATFGMFTDKFGFHWMLNYDKPKT